VHLPWHTAKKPANSASDHYLPCANTLAHGKDSAFVVCQAGKAHGKDPCHVIRPVAREILPWVTLGTRQRLALPMPVCRVPFAVCGTRQTLCRGILGLCRARQRGRLP